MILKYSQTANALYIYLKPDVRPTRGEEIDPGTIVDLDETGAIVGIEVLNPARNWPLEEIADRFPLEMNEHLQLMTLWDRNMSRPFPYVPTPQAVASSAASRELLRARRRLS
jgi:uncharacterized protein YuzE